MNKKIAFISISITLLLIGAAMFYTNSYQETKKIAISRDELDFTLTYPDNISVEKIANGIKITKWGPNQKENAGLSDGIWLEITTGSLHNLTLEEYVKETISYYEASQGETSIWEDLKESTLNSYQTYEYSTGGLGITKHTYFLHPNKSDTYIEISSIVKDPNEQGFDATVAQILSSLEFVK